MLGTTLDTALGMIFVFLLASLVCTAAQEFVESLLKQRSGYLFTGCRRLMGEQALPGGCWLLRKLGFEKPAEWSDAIGTASKAVADAQQVLDTANTNLATTQAAADVDKNDNAKAEAAAIAKKVVAAAEKDLSDKKKAGQPAFATDWVLKLYDHPLIRSLKRSESDFPSYIPSAVFTQVIMDLVRSEAGTSPFKTIQEFRDALSKIQNQAIRDALTSLTATVDINGKLEELQSRIGGWFDAGMDRVSSWYKRWAQRWIFAIGIVTVIAVNIDAIAIGQSLWDDPALRNSIAAAAEKQLNEKDAAGKELTPEEGWKKIEVAKNRLKVAGLPIGWSMDDPRTNCKTFNWLTKILGWLITILAVSLGAPFWFDVLNQFMVVRNTIKPKEKSGSEAPKDPTANQGQQGKPQGG
jgi:hypothetical protein